MGLDMLAQFCLFWYDFTLNMLLAKMMNIVALANGMFRVTWSICVFAFFSHCFTWITSFLTSERQHVRLGKLTLGSLTINW